MKPLSSFAIEHIQPTRQRAARFSALLQRMERDDYLNKPALIELQHAIVDTRYVLDDYRGFQNMAERLYGFIEETLNHEWIEEPDFLLYYDRAKRAIQEIVEMPEQRLDLFIRCCLQNRGRLSKKTAHVRRADGSGNQQDGKRMPRT